MKHRIALAWAALFLCPLAGCNAFLAERLVAPPNGGHPAAVADDPAAGRLAVPVGPPAATVAAWVNEPEGAPRGTVLLLHGFLNNHHQLDAAAAALRARGYRTVQVDLRGHGDSTGDHITFGVQDARDLVRLTDDLQRRGLCGPAVGVYGVSYGAATALLYAAADPRVAAVVAVAPFARLRDEAPHFGRTLLPVPGGLLSDADYVDILDAAGAIAGFRPDDASPLAAITRTRAPILLFHGDLDAVIPVEASERLHAAAPDHTQLTVIPGEGHLGLSFDPFGKLRPASAGWFDAHLAAASPQAKAAP